jgi:hypothetical protein
MTQWLRTSRTSTRIALPLLLALAGPVRAQQLIGYVNTRDADITGASDVLDGQAVLMGAARVTARDHTAPVTLGRGGTVRVCQTSVLHLTESRAVAVAAPLLFSLDRGAIEIQMMGTPSDSIMTPDMRFTVRKSGPLDLRMRVARNGDTCVENRGSSAPTLSVSDPFGEAMYEVGPGQHILFEHGSLHEVVDHETSACGCPDPKGMSMADALLASGGPRPAAPPPAPPAATAPAPPAVVQPTPPPVVRAAPSVIVQTVPAPIVQAAVPAASPAAPVPHPAAAPRPVVVVQTAPPPPARKAPNPAAELAAQQAALQAAEQTAAQRAIQAAEAAQLHPFPAAISEGLAPMEPAPPVPPGRPQAPISDTLSYNAPSAPAPAPAPAAPSRTKKARAAKAARAPAAVAPAKPAPAATPPPNDLAHIIGRFFRRLFGGD